MNILKSLFVAGALLTLSHNGIAAAKSSSKFLQCFDTGKHTITKIKTANIGDEQLIIGSSYYGEIVALDFSGKVLWESKTGIGTLNHDIWCDDITGDDKDEIFAANGDGFVYCFDSRGKLMWRYTPVVSHNQTPMYAVTVVRDKSKTPYVVCSNFDNSIYYVDKDGKQVKEVKSSLYSKNKTWGPKSTTPPPGLNYANYLRSIPRKDGSDVLLLHGANNHMQGEGIFYIFEPLADKPFNQYLKTQAGGEIGYLVVVDPDGDGVYELNYSCSTISGAGFSRLVFSDDSYSKGTILSNTFSPKVTGTAYRVNQFFPVYGKDSYSYSVISADRLFLLDNIGNTAWGKDKYAKRLNCNYTFNDALSLNSGKLLIASSQDGGSCIYMFDTTNPKWAEAYATIEPAGKIASVWANEAIVRKNLAKFEKPSYQRAPRKVVAFEGREMPVVSKLKNSAAIEVYEQVWNSWAEERSWRSPLYDGNVYQDKRDRRRNYEKTSEEIVDLYTEGFENTPGIQMWAGHGNDPLYFQRETLEKIARYGYEHGKKPSIFVYPEMNGHDADFAFMQQNQIFPLADVLKEINGKITLRAKNIYFQGPIYTKTWEKVVAGEYATVFIPAMEETTDKTQDLSIVGRMGLWAAGSVDGWAVRCSRDDSSFDRSRQYSSQKVGNHFFRKTLFSLACGASYIHDTYMNKEHMGLFLELLDKEALFVPERNEIVSFSPVHVAMTTPDEGYLESGENHKWNVFFDREKEDANPQVFGHLNGSWIGASTTPWDFSTYASGVNDRRLNPIPAWNNGIVLITPVQEGALADKDAPRGKLTDHLHPMYKNITKEFITNGKDYISADGKEHYKADEYYTVVKKAIEEGAKKLPVVVSNLGDGRVGWVVAQVSPTHLRLSLVDGASLSPEAQSVQVKFQNIDVVNVVDVMDGKSFNIKNNQTTIDVPCGMFRFIDIEIAKPL